MVFLGSEGSINSLSIVQFSNLLILLPTQPTSSSFVDWFMSWWLIAILSSPSESQSYTLADPHLYQFLPFLYHTFEADWSLTNPIFGRVLGWKRPLCL